MQKEESRNLLHGGLQDSQVKVLYGTGAIKLNDKTGKAERVGGIKWTIKDGIVYDAKKLLADVARMVEKQKRDRLKVATSGQGAQRE